MLHYCKKCGRVIKNSNKIKEFKCDYCNSLTYPVPEKYWLDGLDFLISNESKQLLRDELVITSPEFDQYLYDHRDADLAKDWAKVEAAIDSGKAILEGRDKSNKFGVECPYCHATNVRKISTTAKAVNAAIFGLLGNKRRYQWHCDKCGSDF